jgi:hypothetical protein
VIRLAFVNINFYRKNGKKLISVMNIVKSQPTQQIALNRSAACNLYELI